MFVYVIGPPLIVIGFACTIVAIVTILADLWRDVRGRAPYARVGCNTVTFNTEEDR